MLDNLTRSVKESVRDGYNNPENTTPKGFFQNVASRFKGRLIFSLVFFLIFGAVALGIILLVLFFILKAM